LFAPVSIGFGKEESSLIYSALKKMAVEKKAERVRFWGKILAKNKDYLVVEGYTKESNAGEPMTPDTEKMKEGANYNTYWVTQNIRIHVIYSVSG
jgi:radial spoke head protein 4A